MKIVGFFFQTQWKLFSSLPHHVYVYTTLEAPDSDLFYN